jgi:hypothetical protein
MAIRRMTIVPVLTVLGALVLAGPVLAAKGGRGTQGRATRMVPAPLA